MKWILLFGAALTASLAWACGAYLGVWATFGIVDRTPYYANLRSQPIPLYPESPRGNAVSSYLKPNHALKLMYRERSGACVYLKSSNEVVTPREAVLASGFSIQGYGFIKDGHMRVLLLASAIASILLLFLVFRPRPRKKKINRNQLEAQLQAEQHRRSSLATSLRAQKAGYEQQIATLNSEARSALKSARDRLERSIRKESDTRLNATISDMEGSYTRLEHEYEQFRREAKVFGIDKDDPRAFQVKLSLVRAELPGI